MRRVKSRNTTPERQVRALLRRMGHTGYRLHRKDVPGKPDVAFIGRKIAIFVHGCFWHGHDCKRGARAPRANADYWRAKIARNRERDAAAEAALARAGWSMLAIWECELKDMGAVEARLAALLARPSA
jgi:DNA mismatch endonuclease (patch repair protein)